MDRPLIVKSDKCKEGLSFDLSHEDVVEQLLPMFEKEVYVVLPNDLIEDVLKHKGEWNEIWNWRQG